MTLHVPPALRAALFAMDGRTGKTMAMYLKGPCRGVAVVVDEDEADLDLIDADHAKAADIIKARRAANPGRPLVLLSLYDLRVENAFFVKKPVNAQQMLSVFAQVRDVLAARKVAEKLRHPASRGSEAEHASESVSSGQPRPERLKSSKHRTAAQLSDSGFRTFLGTLADIDFDDPAQWRTAYFDPRHYFLGFVQSAFKTARLQHKALRLNSIWKPLLIFPESEEIWLDADDKQLRAFAGVVLNRASAGNMTLSVFDLTDPAPRDAEKHQDMSAFLWKLAIWTSKGRFPIGIDIYKPVYLDRWPNFTRLVITPEALRIAALLIQQPRTPLEIAEVLRIKMQYVFVFVCACHTLGLLRQSERQADAVVAQPAPRPAKNQGLLSKILGKLRGEQ